MEQAETADGAAVLEAPSDVERSLLRAVEQSEVAYRAALEEAGWPASALAVAVWMLENGERCRSTGGDLCRRIPLQTRRIAAGRARMPVASFHRGLERLAASGVLLETATGWVLNLTRCVVVAEARSSCGLDVPEFDPGWQPAAAAPREARQTAGSCFTPVSVCSSPVSLSPSTENENLKIPSTEYRVPESGKLEQPETAAPPVAAPIRNRSAASLADLNRTPAWQTLQNALFFTSDGRRTIPPLPILKAAFVAAVNLGFLTDDYDGKRAFLASAHDCALRADRPAAALAWRIAHGKVWKSGNDSHEWAKAVLNRSAVPVG